MQQIGQRLPSTLLLNVCEGEHVAQKSDDFFRGKRVILFGLPGAFTPICSTSHLPRFEALASEFLHAGVDAIVCIATNDCFVLDVWRKQLGIQHVKFVSDPSGAFTAAMGLLVASDTLGTRSRRYSLVALDGVVEQFYIEDESGNDSLTVSDADTLLAAITGKPKPPAVLLFAVNGCPACERAKELLDRQGLRYEIILIGTDINVQALRAATGQNKLPQVFIDGRYVGGYDQLQQHFELA